MPQALAGTRVEGHERGAEEVRARPVGAIVVVGRRPGREVGDPARGVDRNLSPRVRAADVLVGVLRPGVVAELARMRDRSEPPDFLAGDDVVGAKVAGRRHVILAGGRTEDDQVLEDLARRARLHATDGRGIASRESFAQVDRAVLAEREDGLAGQRVERLELVIALIDEPAIRAIAALPVIDASRRDPLQVLVYPDFLARRRIEGDERLIARQDVHQVVDDDGAEDVGEVVARGVGPRHLEPADVGSW